MSAGGELDGRLWKGLDRIAREHEPAEAAPRVPMHAARIAAARALARAHPERGMGMSEMDAMTALAAATPHIIEDFLNWQAAPKVTVETDAMQAALIRMAMATAWDEGARSVHTHTSSCSEGCAPGNPYRGERGDD